MHEESIFAAALEKLTPAERAAYLKGACAGDLELHRRVEALLEAHEQSGDLLDPPANFPGPLGVERLDSAFADPNPDPAGRRAARHSYRALQAPPARSARAAWASCSWPSRRRRSGARWR